MALSIKTAEADRLARELALRTGESLTTAVTVALQERLTRVGSGFHSGFLDGIDALSDDFLQHATDARSADEIVGYDEAGLPT